MLRKKELYTIITPIPGFIPRRLALDILHSHSEVITLNPLVLEHHPISAPRNAAADEYYSTWYEIIERIQYVPGIGKMGSGKISFNGCFHDMPWGLQTHIYAPMNIDLRSRYSIGGNQPGIEPLEHREIGLEALGAPKDGLYLREDIEIKCSVGLVGYVKAQTKAANKEMVQRIIKKAELLDAGVLKGMMEDGRLRTINPNDRSSTFSNPLSQQSTYSSGMASPSLNAAMVYNPRDSPNAPSFSRPDAAGPDKSYPPYGPNSYNIAPSSRPVHMELPGDMLHPSQIQAPYPSPTGTPHWYRDSTSSSDPRWSQGQLSPSASENQRTSMSSLASTGGNPSPAAHQQTFAAELSAHNETTEEHQHHPQR